ncbi:MAG: hypothetical protein RL398_3601 [Planctomycetota bacterium]
MHGRSAFHLPLANELLSQARARAERSGLNLFGLVSASRFDSCQPCDRRVQSLRDGCGTIVVLGTGGRAFWSAYVQSRSGAVQGTQAAADADRYAQRSARELGEWLVDQGIAATTVLPGASRGVRFQCLAEAAGLGVVSPVTGQLLHPTYGPWMSVRAVLLLDGEPFGPIDNASIAHEFQPCCGCPRPCVSACAPHAYDGNGKQDLDKCAPHRDAGNCGEGCNTRLACPLGAEHRDAPDEFAHRHGQTLAVLRRLAGLGLWSLVPKGLRS